MLKCREIEKMIGTDELRAAGFIRRQTVRLHLMMCRHCRTYARQIRAIGDAARTRWMHAPIDPRQADRIFSRIFNE